MSSMRRIHILRELAHDDRRGWRRQGDLLAELAVCQAALAGERARTHRLVDLLGEQAAELAVLRSTLDAVRGLDRRATA